jgi:hypothetical protein
MNAYLEVWKGSVCERIPLVPGERFTIGRHSESDLLLPEKSVSRVHAVIDRVGTGWLLSDLSSNGTTVNGAHIVGRQVAIAPGATVVIGSASIVLRDASQGAAEETITRSVPRPHVTPAERRVLLALCRPLVTDGPVRQPASVAQMAAELTTNDQTVKFHLKNLYAKFDVPAAGLSRRGLLADAALRSGAVNLADLRGTDD